MTHPSSQSACRARGRAGFEPVVASSSLGFLLGGHFTGPKYLQLHFEYLQLRAEKSPNERSAFEAAVSDWKYGACDEMKRKTPTRLDRRF